MTLSSEPAASVPPMPPSATAPRRPIIALAHPGGRYPGVELPPAWFPDWKRLPRIASVLPPAGDLGAIYEAVQVMGAEIRAQAEAAFDAGMHPMLIGGDHSLAIGTIAAATSRHERVGVIWIDAHADFNVPETSPSGNPHGMPLSASCGLGDARLTGLFSRFVRPSDVVLIAARDIDPGEEALLKEHGIWHVTVSELREMGLPALVKAVSARLDGLSVHLSFDFDAISAECFSATGTPVPEGLLPDEGAALLAGLAGSGLSFVSSDWVEFDPRHETAPECAALARRMYESFHGGLLG